MSLRLPFVRSGLLFDRRPFALYYDYDAGLEGALTPFEHEESLQSVELQLFSSKAGTRSEEPMLSESCRSEQLLEHLVLSLQSEQSGSHALSPLLGDPGVFSRDACSLLLMQSLESGSQSVQLSIDLLSSVLD